jgi:hypothetical protein
MHKTSETKQSYLQHSFLPEDGLKDDEITQCMLKCNTVVSHICMKEHKGAGIAICSFENKLQYTTQNGVQKKV